MSVRMRTVPCASGSSLDSEDGCWWFYPVLEGNVDQSAGGAVFRGPRQTRFWFAGWSQPPRKRWVGRFTNSEPRRGDTADQSDEGGKDCVKLVTLSDTERSRKAGA